MNQRAQPATAGFTLVEVLIALAIGALLSATLVGLLATTSRLAARHAAMSGIQESTRTALAILHHAILAAGFDACSGATHWQGLDVTSAGFDAGLHDRVDAIVLNARRHRRHARGDQLVVQTMVALPSIDVVGENTMPQPHQPSLRLRAPAPWIDNGDIVRLVGLDLGVCLSLQRSNGPSGLLLARDAGLHQPGNRPVADDQPTLSGRMLVHAPERTRFFVAESTVMPGHYSLFRARLGEGDRALELLEGVYDLRVEYLVASAGGPVQARRANDPTLLALGPSAIVGVRLHLLIYGVDVDRLPAPARVPVAIAGEPFDPPDDRLYRSITRTVHLRNPHRQNRRRNRSNPRNSAVRHCSTETPTASDASGGSVLIGVLGIMLLVTLLTATAAQDALLQLRLAAAQRSQLHAQLGAEAALQQLANRIEQDTFDHLTRPVMALVTGAEWRQALHVYGSTLPITTPDGAMRPARGTIVALGLIERLPDAVPPAAETASETEPDDTPDSDAWLAPERFRLTVLVNTSGGGETLLQTVEQRHADAATGGDGAATATLQRLSWKRIP